MQPFFASWLDFQPPGTCIVYSNLNAAFNVPITGFTTLDAGSSFTVTGPQGNLHLGNPGKDVTLSASGKFLVPGAYTITGTGGANVGSFSAAVAIPLPSTLVSPVNNSTATRANGMTVTWTGGSGNLQVEVNSCSNNSCSNGASAVCIVPATAGTFTVPPYILEALPAGNSAGLVLSSYSMASFTATGLNAGTLLTYSNDSGFGYGWGSGGFTLK
jgi:hypothetical protein